MPRKIVPAFGRDEEVEAPAAVVEKAETTLMKLLGADMVSVEMRAVAARYAHWRAQEANRPQRRQSSAALLSLEAAATRLGATGSSDDRSTVGAIVWGLPYHVDFEFRLILAGLRRQAGRDGEAAMNLDDTVLDRPVLITTAARRTYDESSVQRGPNPDNTLRLTVQHLVELYEMTKGRRATYGRGKDGVHSHTATSPVGVFITAYFQEMEPQLAGSRPAEALHHVIASRR